MWTSVRRHDPILQWRRGSTLRPHEMPWACDEHAFGSPAMLRHALPVNMMRVNIGKEITYIHAFVVTLLGLLSLNFMHGFHGILLRTRLERTFPSSGVGFFWVSLCRAEGQGSGLRTFSAQTRTQPRLQRHCTRFNPVHGVVRSVAIETTEASQRPKVQPPPRPRRVIRRKEHLREGFS